MSNYVIIFAGGVGNRMGSSTPKQFLEINSKSVLAYTIDKFEQCYLIDSIIVVSKQEYVDRVNEIINKHNFQKIKKVIAGGITAMDSQFNGLKELKSIGINNEDIVLLHDGVRPLIDEKTIVNCINAVKEKGNAITVSLAIETIAYLDDNKISNIVPRESCVLARAPQCFKFKDIYDAHIKMREEGLSFVDSASLMMHYGYKLNTVIGPSENIKITTKQDFYMAECLLTKKGELN